VKRLMIFILTTLLILPVAACRDKGSKFSMAHRLNGVGIALYSRGNIPEALERFQQALTYTPDFAFGRNNVAVSYYHRGQLDLAIAEFRRAVELEPDIPEIHGNLGVAFMLQERYVEAERELNKAISLDKEYVLAYSNLGVLLYRTGRTSEAIKIYKKGIKLDPALDRLHHNLGEAFHSEGDYKGAIRHYNLALKLNPGSAKTFNNLAWTYAQRGENIEDALALATAAVEADQKNGFYYDTLAWVYFKQGLFEEARQTVMKAIEFQPGIPDFHYHFGEILRWQGRYKEAVEEYGRVLGIEPYGIWADRAEAAIWAIKGL